jgi:SAM-dependent methyltransferase
LLNGKIVLYHLKRKLDQLLGKSITDDFDWEHYNTHYRGELQGITHDHALILKEGDYTFRGEGLIKAKEGLLPLHPNHRLLYETVVQLKPASVFELGCGGGDHLANISLLLKNVKLYGADLSQQQLEFLKERHPRLDAVTRQFDCTLPFSPEFSKVDVAYTQAVVMHIKTGNGHLIALYNLFNVAAKQVALMENWTAHFFVEDIKRLHSLKLIPWKELHFYYRDSEELKKPHLMIVSSTPLPYKKLTDYSILRDGVGR